MVLVSVFSTARCSSPGIAKGLSAANTGNVLELLIILSICSLCSKPSDGVSYVIDRCRIRALRKAQIVMPNIFLK